MADEQRGASAGIHEERMIDLILPFLPPKEFSRNSRDHWSKLHRVQDGIAADVYALLLESGWRPGEPFNKAGVSVEFVLPDRRRRDGDNLITSSKPILDALVTHRLIKDDDLSCIGIPNYTYRYSRRKEALTVLKIDEVKPA